MFWFLSKVCVLQYIANKLNEIYYEIKFSTKLHHHLNVTQISYSCISYSFCERSKCLQILGIVSKLPSSVKHICTRLNIQFLFCSLQQVVARSRTRRPAAVRPDTRSSATRVVDTHLIPYRTRAKDCTNFVYVFIIESQICNKKT